MKPGERMLRISLRLAPRAFRQRYGEEVLETHRARMDQAAAHGRTAMLRLAVREVAGGVWLAVRLRAGMSPPRPGPTTTPEGRRGHALDAVVQDLRFARRTLSRNPGYALTAVLVLALGIGANTAIFSAVNASFFRPLPFADAGRLVMLYETNPEFGWSDAHAAPANVLDWREQVSGFADIAAYSEFVGRATYIRDGEPVLIGASAVTGNFFSVLGTPAALGRTFRWEETWEGNDAVVVLSHDLWMTHFGGDSGIVGRTLEFVGNTVEVVGVAPPGFGFPTDRTQLWYPWGWTPESRDAVSFRRAHFVRPIARLAPGIAPEAANAQLQHVVQRLQADYPATNSVMGAGMMPLRDFLIRDVRRPLMILLGAVSLLLLLACANVANLTLVRAADRSRELALRQALGAGRLRLARQMLTESLMLAAAGGVLGLGLGWVGVQAMASLTSLGIEGATAMALDGRVVLFTCGMALLSGLLFGIVPALRGTGGRLHGTLTDGGTGGSAGAGRLRTVRFLVAAEVGLALLLVVGAGLMARSFMLIRQVDPGFRTDGVLAVQFGVPGLRYENRDQVLAFYDRLADALEGRQGIERVGTVGQLPLNGTNWSSQLSAEGWPPERVGFEILHRRADRGYFEALEIPLIRGRLFEPGDRPDGPRVVVINETLARELFPDEDPIGRRVAFSRAPDATSTWHEIIGIVGDQHQVSPVQPTRAEVFENRDQDWGRNNWVVMRTAGAPMSVLPVVREVLRELDPLIPLAEARSLGEIWRESIAREEFILTLLGVFGLVALLLAAVGVYAVTAQAARKRTREFGIRMALGAEASHVIGLMLRQSLLVVGLGVAAGLMVSLVATRALRTVLYGVAPGDPLTLASVAIVLVVVAGLASYLPARRATALDPVSTLKEE